MISSMVIYKKTRTSTTNKRAYPVKTPPLTGLPTRPKLKGIEHLKLANNPTTPFQQQVYFLTQLIPVGKVTSYGAIAKLLRSSPRAVGQALRRNPFAPIVPCHRVVAANGALCGFNGSPCCEPNSKKGSLLLKEGVKITVNKLTGEALVDKEYMIDEDTLRDLVRRDRSAAAQ